MVLLPSCQPQGHSKIPDHFFTPAGASGFLPEVAVSPVVVAEVPTLAFYTPRFLTSFPQGQKEGGFDLLLGTGSFAFKSQDLPSLRPLSMLCHRSLRQYSGKALPGCEQGQGHVA